VEERDMLVGTRFGIGGCRARKVLEKALSISSAECRMNI
jgi:hypothetical protein